jgi:hypothetical protein
MLTGDKKKLYQRNYMRMRRAAIGESNHNAASVKLIDGIVRPTVRPQVDADGNVLYDDW